MLARASDKTSGQSLTDIQIVAQTYTFMLAGARHWLPHLWGSVACPPLVVRCGSEAQQMAGPAPPTTAVSTHRCESCLTNITSYHAVCAGYDTTGMTLAHAVYAIASNPDIEARLLAEIDGFG